MINKIDIMDGYTYKYIQKIHIEYIHLWNIYRQRDIEIIKDQKIDRYRYRYIYI